MYALKYEIPDANTGISDETKPDLMTSDESNKDEANEDEADDDDVKSGVVKLDRKNKHAYELNETQKKEVSHNTNERVEDSGFIKLNKISDQKSSSIINFKILRHFAKRKYSFNLILITKMKD